MCVAAVVAVPPSWWNACLVLTVGCCCWRSVLKLPATDLPHPSPLPGAQVNFLTWQGAALSVTSPVLVSVLGSSSQTMTAMMSGMSVMEKIFGTRASTDVLGAKVSLGLGWGR